MFRWGILSTAKIGREQLIPAIGASSNGVVTAIASRSLEKAQALAAQCNAPKAYGGYEELLDDPEIDGVYIPLHTSGHIEWSLKAAQAGKHVLCEKPIAMQADEIDQLVAAQTANKVVISEAFMVFYHPQWHKVRALLASGAIGKLRHVEGAFAYHLLDETNMRNQAELGGGGLRDIGVYPTVTTRIATGQEPEKLRAYIEYDPKFKTDIYARVDAEFPEFSLHFYCSTQMALRQHMAFHGNAGVITLSAPFNAGAYDHARVTLYTQSHSEAQIWEYPGVNQYKLQLEAFVNATQGEGDIFSLDQSKKNQKVIDACFRAGETHGWVEV